MVPPYLKTDELLAHFSESRPRLSSRNSSPLCGLTFCNPAVSNGPTESPQPSCGQNHTSLGASHVYDLSSPQERL